MIFNMAKQGPTVRYDEISEAVEDATSVKMDEATELEGNFRRVATDVITPRDTTTQHSSKSMSYTLTWWNMTWWTTKKWKFIIIFIMIITASTTVSEETMKDTI